MMKNISADGTSGRFELTESTAGFNGDISRVSDLAAHFGVEVGAIEDQSKLFILECVGRRKT